MDKEKEINQLGQDIAYICPDQVTTYCGDINCVSCLSKGLVNVGYRKADEVRKETLQALLLYCIERRNAIKKYPYDNQYETQGARDEIEMIIGFIKTNAKMNGVEVDE